MVKSNTTDTWCLLVHRRVVRACKLMQRGYHLSACFHLHHNHILEPPARASHLHADASQCQGFEHTWENDGPSRKEKLRPDVQGHQRVTNISSQPTAEGGPYRSIHNSISLAAYYGSFASLLLVVDRHPVQTSPRPPSVH